MPDGFLEFGKDSALEVFDPSWLMLPDEEFALVARFSLPDASAKRCVVVQKGPLMLTLAPPSEDRHGRWRCYLFFRAENGLNIGETAFEVPPDGEMTVAIGRRDRRPWMSVNGVQVYRPQGQNNTSTAPIHDLTLQIGGANRGNITTNASFAPLDAFQGKMHWVLGFGPGEFDTAAISASNITSRSAMQAAGDASVLAHYDFTTPKPAELRHRQASFRVTGAVDFGAKDTRHRVFYNFNNQQLAAGSPVYGDDTNPDFTIMAMVSIVERPTQIIGRMGPNAWNDIVREPWSLDISISSGLVLSIPTTDGKVVEVCSERQDFFNGQAYTVAATRDGTRVTLYVDGKVVHDAYHPELVNAHMPLDSFFIGGPHDEAIIASPAQGGPYHYYKDMDLERFSSLSNIAMWTRALSKEELHDAAFGAVKTADPALLGFWPLDGSPRDFSDHGQDLRRAKGRMYFAPRIRELWCGGMNGHHYVQFSLSEKDAEQGEGKVRQAEKSFDVVPGCPGFVMSIISDYGSDPLRYPPEAKVILLDPDGTKIDTAADTDEAFVMVEGDSPRAVTLVNPKPGRWWVEVASRDTTPFTLRLESIPTKDAAETSVRTLGAVLRNAQNPLPGRHMQTQFFLMAGAALVAGVSLIVALIHTSGTQNNRAIVRASSQFTGRSEADVEDAMNRFGKNPHNMAGKIAYMAGFEGVASRVLLIDPAVENDKPTKAGYSVRKRLLYPVVAEGPLKDQTDYLLREQVTKKPVSDALRAIKHGLVSACGHGLPQEYFGWHKGPASDGVFQRVLYAETVTEEEAAGKIFHIIACRCGEKRSAALGAKLVEKGALAFFGYSERYQIPGVGMNFSQEDVDTLVRCDIEIDIALLEGASCDEAYRRAMAMYRNAYYDNIQNNRALALAIMHNQDCLVAPSVDSTFGDGAAHLNVAMMSQGFEAGYADEDERKMFTE